MRKIQVFLIILATYMALACSATQPKAQEKAAPLPPTKKESLLQEIEKRYTSTPAFIAKIKKTLKLKLLDQERIQEGTLQIKKPGMFRLELEGTEKSTAITDGKTIWVVNYPTDPSFDNTVRVIRSQNPKKLQSQTLMAFILGQGALLKQYVVKSQRDEGELKTFELEAKDKSEDVNRITVVTSPTKKEIIALKYSDKLDNQTVIELFEGKFDQKIETKQFKFSVPKGAEITDI